MENFPKIMDNRGMFGSHSSDFENEAFIQESLFEKRDDLRKPKMQKTINMDSDDEEMVMVSINNHGKEIDHEAIEKKKIK